MLAVLVLKLFREPKIDQIDSLAVLVESDGEVLRLDVPVDDVLLMQLFDSQHHLVAREADGPERQLALALVEQALQIRSQKVHYEVDAVRLLLVINQLDEARQPAHLLHDL